MTHVAAPEEEDSRRARDARLHALEALLRDAAAPEASVRQHALKRLQAEGEALRARPAQPPPPPRASVSLRLAAAERELREVRAALTWPQVATAFRVAAQALAQEAHNHPATRADWSAAGDFLLQTTRALAASDTWARLVSEALEVEAALQHTPEGAPDTAAALTAALASAPALLLTQDAAGHLLALARAVQALALRSRPPLVPTPATHAEVVAAKAHLAVLVEAAGVPGPDAQERRALRDAGHTDLPGMMAARVRTHARARAAFAEAATLRFKVAELLAQHRPAEAESLQAEVESLQARAEALAKDDYDCEPSS